MSVARPFALGVAFVLSSVPVVAQEPAAQEPAAQQPVAQEPVAQEPARRVSLTVIHAADGRTAADLEPAREALLTRLENCRNVAARVAGDARVRFRLAVNARGVVAATSLAEGAVSAEARRWHGCAMRALARARLAAGVAGTLDVVVAWTTEREAAGRAGGQAGLGVSGGSVGGGGAGEGTLGLGTLGTLSGVGSPPSGPGVSVRALVPEVTGSLSPDMVRRVVRRHLNQVRYCYESALRQTPGLEGEIRLSFTIAADGSVPVTNVAANTVGSPEVAACIASRPRTWLFPQPEGGGTVVVNQTFVFAPTS